MGISTHVLDTSRGRPAAGIAVTVERLANNGWQPLALGTTDHDGRLKAYAGELEAGLYRITFELKPYFEEQGVVDFFYPKATIDFEIRDAQQHFHVPLLLSPFGYSTYRGS